MTSVMTAMLRTVFPAAGCGGAAVGAAAAADGEARGVLEEAATWRRGMRELTRAGGAATGAPSWRNPSRTQKRKRGLGV